MMDDESDLMTYKMRTRLPLTGLCIITTSVLNGHLQPEEEHKKKEGKTGERNLV